jgi:hypothetical protein
MNIIEQEKTKDNKKSENTDNKKSENTDNKKSENINLNKNKYNLPNCSFMNLVCKNRKRAVENFSKTNEILEFEKNVPEKYLLENYLCHNKTKMSYNVLNILNLYDYFYPSYMNFSLSKKNFDDYEKRGKKNYEEIRKNLNSYKFLDKAIINYLKEVLNNAYQYYKKMISFIKKNGLTIDDPKYWAQLHVLIKGKKSREGFNTEKMCNIIQKQSICKREQDSNKLSFENFLISNYKKEMNFPKCQFTDNSWKTLYGMF